MRYRLKFPASLQLRAIPGQGRAESSFSRTKAKVNLIAAILSPDFAEKIIARGVWADPKNHLVAGAMAGLTGVIPTINSATVA
jgi:hypothetical protein